MERLLEDPVVPTGGQPSDSETAALESALTGYLSRRGRDDFSSLLGFLESNEHSPWTASLLANLGFEYYKTGHYSLALEAWREAWEGARTATDLAGRAVADRAVGELASMHARLGQADELDALLAAIDGRVVSGPATERLAGAREALWNMHHRPEISFRCGPLALYRIKVALDPHHAAANVFHAVRSSRAGFSLKQLETLSHEVGLNLRMAFRERDVDFVVPSVVHLKADHYAAITRRAGGLWLLEDPTFGNETWVTHEALTAEASGYCLISGEPLQGWREVGASEAETVWGSGLTSGNDDRPHGCDDPTTGGACSGDDDCKGMAVSRVHLMLVSLNINDEPVGYTPPVGPAVRFTVRYNQRDAYQPSTFTYSNLGPKWTFDWLSFIKDDPSQPESDVDLYLMGGGTRRFTGFDPATRSFGLQQFDQTRLTRSVAGDAYELVSKDGTRRVFAQSDGSPANALSRRLFLTSLTDPQGNAVTLTYDARGRLTTLTDAIGQATVLSYEHASDAFKLTRVTDPFGRAATFAYDAVDRLSKITDVIGMASEFTYEHPDGGDFISAMTTPYGVTTFAKDRDDGNTRWLETVYPDGVGDRVEYNQGLLELAVDPPESIPSAIATTNEFLGYRNTFYWSRKAFAEAGRDLRTAKVFHWLHASDLTKTSGILESVKEPLEGRVWFDYAGQRNSVVVGATNQPAHVARVLDDGTTQRYTFEYTALGQVSRLVDPVGRTSSFVYAENGIDLVETYQPAGDEAQRLSAITYNGRHLPTAVTDAAGKTTSYDYNARGQLVTQTDAVGRTTTYTYDAHGYLSLVEGPAPGTATAFTYDAKGRVRSRTDEAGYSVTFEHDDLDRLTKLTFPDLTFLELTYRRRDLVSMRDRAGARTAFEYDAVQQLTKRTDPLGRVTRYQWCKCGALRGLADPLGRTTTWRHDVQGRLTAKQYADGSEVSYLYEQTSSYLSQRTDEQGQVTHYRYNVDGTLAGISYANTDVPTPAVSFTYDPDILRVVARMDGTGMTRFEYVPITGSPAPGAGRLSAIRGPLAVVTYGYDELGRRVSTAVGDSARAVTLDAGGRIGHEANALGDFAYEYDGASGRRVLQSGPNGHSVAFGYGTVAEDQRLSRITTATGAHRAEFAYERAAATGDITVWSEQSDAQPMRSEHVAYDAARQVTAVSTAQGGVFGTQYGYAYDAAGNRVTEQIDATTRRFSYNALNELTAVSDGAAPATYRWDAEQRLASVTEGAHRSELSYDGAGQLARIRQLLGDAEISDRRFVWSDDRIVEERTAAGAVAKRFFDQGVQIEGDAYLYTRDHLGSIRELTDAAGTVRAASAFDPFGRQTHRSGDVDADFGYAGMLRLGDDLALTLYRAYDAGTGRWLSREPQVNAEVQAGTNLFAYVFNNPVNFFDPYGLDCDCNDQRDQLAGARRKFQVDHDGATRQVILAGLAAAGVCAAATIAAMIAAVPTVGLSLAGIAVACGGGVVAIVTVLVVKLQDLDVDANDIVTKAKVLQNCLDRGCRLTQGSPQPGSGPRPGLPRGDIPC